MADRDGAARRPLVGRAGEIAAVAELVHSAARGKAGALLVSGEAGVGKTALVRETAARVGGYADVPWTCKPRRCSPRSRRWHKAPGYRLRRSTRSRRPRQQRYPA